MKLGRRRLCLFLSALGAAVVFSSVVGEARSRSASGSALAHDDLPYYSHGDLLPRWDNWSKRRTVGAFKLVDQTGRRIDERFFRERPTVVAFFWSGCLSTCPISIDLLRNTHKEMGTDPAQVLLISDQPLVDQVPALKSYSRRLGLPSDWLLATGRPDQVYRFARRGLFTNVEARAPDGGPMHTEINFLIDQSGRVRGIYDANSPAAATRLRYDYERLANEDSLSVKERS